jgi:hypothetical protein
MTAKQNPLENIMNGQMYVIPASETRRESFRKDSGRAGMTEKRQLAEFTNKFYF